MFRFCGHFPAQVFLQETRRTQPVYLYGFLPDFVVTRMTPGLLFAKPGWVSYAVGSLPTGGNPAGGGGRFWTTVPADQGHLPLKCHFRTPSTSALGGGGGLARALSTPKTSCTAPPKLLALSYPVSLLRYSQLVLCVTHS